MKFTNLINKFTDNIVLAVKGTVPVRVLNMHDKDRSIRENFFCNLIPNAPNTCQAAKDLDHQPKQFAMNTRHDTRFYDCVAIKAKELNMFDSTVYSRDTVRSGLRHYNENVLNRTTHDLVLLCPDAFMVQKFYNVSVERMQHTFDGSVPEWMVEHLDTVRPNHGRTVT